MSETPTVWSGTPSEKARSLAWSVSDVVAKLMEKSEGWPDGEANDVVWGAIPSLACVRDSLRDLANEMDGGSAQQDTEEEK